MKLKITKISLLIPLGIFIFAIYSCTNTEIENSDDAAKVIVDPDKLPEISFTDTEHDFGKVTEGEKVGWYFYFTNTGGQDLIIQKASSSCGCTVPDYSKEPISPGKEGKIKVVYNSSGRSGFDTKFVNIETNAKNSAVRLKLEVEIIEKSNI